MHTDHERCYRAAESRDARFDGVFFVGVKTTGIYCRPSCPAVTPKRQNVLFYASAAAAQDAGFRACRRCRPDTTPGSPEWNVRADAVGRAMRLIGDGVVEREGVEGLASRLGYSQRHVTRMLTQELGAGPLALARSNRSHAARVLIETTDMPMSDIAFASGFSSIRQFNDSVRHAYALSPTDMRGRRRGTPTGHVTLRLAVRQPFHADGLIEFLGGRAITGVERVEDRTYARVLRLPHGLGVVQLTLHDDHVACELELADLRDTAVAVQRCRRLLDLDSDPLAIDEVLSADPLLAPMVAAAPGLRLPSQVDGFEVAVRAIVGQQVSVVGARTILGRFAETYGTAVTFDLAAAHGLTHAFATPEALAEADDTSLSMPRSRARALIGVAQAVADGKIELDPGSDREVVRERLINLPGIGPWTADYISMRALANPDVMLETDLIIKRILERHGVDADRTERWKPWRSYAAMHLWRNSADPERTEA
ncbi:AraC family transcriptional regulator of adaptative response / DNA-3-methyladenine glycosylase II [Aeromicrobium panaciterrae]|uniref:DNA-3-methyladenine glycosylase II n=1 Tax=Aeromicrobium panaciterrae TaxID=363861 RepID=A0ABU1UQ95_9ACTN|nr:AlkA N-terminal domain-containing protein [Aeromicrobium panaciterrae]MDR7087313.1 AraC family transcriptional regulator of adaptative response / DNA-3-methyladenine glycosylase II [Aeromicrobium panaciterrae]